MSEIQISADLRPLFGPIRDQGARPTCLAFAASDCHAGRRNGWHPLSCEYAFYHAQRRAGQPPDRGAKLSAMLEMLREDGQPEEGSWPYLDTTPADPATWSPPGSVGLLFGRDAITIPATVDQLVTVLDQGLPIILLLKLCKAFFGANHNTLVIDAEISAISATPPRHAIVVVGYGSLNNNRVLLIRNSWGGGWGHGGYAWLTEAYLSPRIFAAAVLTEDIDGFQHPTIA